MPQYLEQLKKIFDDVSGQRLFIGRNESYLTFGKKEDLAQLYNAFGFYSGRCGHFLHATPRMLLTIRSRSRTQGQQSGVWTIAQPAIYNQKRHRIMEIEKNIATRAVANNPQLICAIYQKGGCSKAFKSKESLCEWVLKSGNWREKFRQKT